MPLVARAFDDILIDNILTSLTNFRTEQIVFDPNVYFYIDRDRRRQATQLPLVNVWADGISPESRASTRTHIAETVTVNVDCIAAQFSDDDIENSDRKAVARLSYLKEQVKQCLYGYLNTDLGFPVGIIAKKDFPTWSIFKDDGENPESSIIGGKWSFSVTYAWEPQALDLVKLNSIKVNSHSWDLLYTY